MIMEEEENVFFLSVLHSLLTFRVYEDGGKNIETPNNRCRLLFNINHYLVVLHSFTPRFANTHRQQPTKLLS